MKLAFGYVHPGVVAHEFMHSAMQLRGGTIVIPKTSGPLIARARNEIVSYFLETDATHLWMVDSDIKFDPDVGERLAARKRAIVSALYYSRDPDGTVFPVAVKRKNGKWDNYQTRTELKPNTGIHKVDAIGMGCALIARSVLEKLPVEILSPFAEGVWGPENVVLGEDAMFCMRAMEAGFTTWLDTDVKVGHVKREVL